MYIDIVPNRNSPPAILLRESYREGGKVKKKTVTNISHWPMDKVIDFKRFLKNEPMLFVGDAIIIQRTIPHGHVKAVLGTIKKIGLDKIISSKPCPMRALVIAMIAEQLIHPTSKLATTRLWHDTTLAIELGVKNADEDDLYAAMDWLYRGQNRIEKKLAARHLKEGGHALYDVTSSYYEGRTCPLAQYGHNKDKKKGRQIIVYGIMCNAEGVPVAVEVYPGNTGDPKTVPDQVEKLRSRFGLRKAVLVGDRGMLTEARIDKIKEYPGLGWISALRSKSVRGLVDKGYIQLSLFDEKNLAEITSPDFPGERLVVCKNPLLAEERTRKREDLLRATEKDLRKIEREVARRTRTILTAGEIGKKVGKVISRFKMDKHFKMTIADGVFSFERDEESTMREASLDGIYVVRTSEPAEKISAEDVVRGYKKLTKVEKLFRTLKGMDIKVRPIRHRGEVRVRTHIFICMLAYYVEWHMRRTLSLLLFDDEEIEENRRMRDPVAKAEPSLSAKRKKWRRKTDDGFVIQSFESLMIHLGTMCKNRCGIRGKGDTPDFWMITEETPLQRRVFEMLKL